MAFFTPTPPPRNRSRFLEKAAGVYGTNEGGIVQAAWRDAAYLGTYEKHLKNADEEEEKVAAESRSAPSSRMLSPRPPMKIVLSVAETTHIQREDPRPYVLGVPRATERSRCRAQYMADLNELHRRQQRAFMVGTALENKHDLLCAWAMGAFLIAENEQQKQQQQQEDQMREHVMVNMNSGEPAAKTHFLSVVEELYVRQVKNGHEEVQHEEAREYRSVVFAHRREIFVFSLPIRHALRKFIARWAAVRRAKLLTARLRREHLQRREQRTRGDMVQEAAVQSAELMMFVTAQLADITKTRLIAFLMSIQRGVWCGSLTARECLERYRLCWGSAAPLPPVTLLVRFQQQQQVQEHQQQLQKLDPSQSGSCGGRTFSQSRGLLVSLQCAEIADRDTVLDEQSPSWLQLVKHMQRSLLEYRCVTEKSHGFAASMHVLTGDILPQAQYVLHYHARRDVENSEFETRCEYTACLLELCDIEIAASIVELKERAQARILDAYRRHKFKQQRRSLQTRVLVEVMRQERESESRYANDVLYRTLVDALQERVSFVESSFRAVIEWQLYGQCFLPQAALFRHGLALDGRHYSMPDHELCVVAAFLPRLHFQDQVVRERLAEVELQQRRDIAQEAREDWAQHSKVLSLSVRLVGKIEHILRATAERHLPAQQPSPESSSSARSHWEVMLEMHGSELLHLALLLSVRSEKGSGATVAMPRDGEQSRARSHLSLILEASDRHLPHLAPVLLCPRDATPAPISVTTESASPATTTTADEAETEAEAVAVTDVVEEPPAPSPLAVLSEQEAAWREAQEREHAEFMSFLTDDKNFLLSRRLKQHRDEIELKQEPERRSRVEDDEEHLRDTNFLTRYVRLRLRHFQAECEATLLEHARTIQSARETRAAGPAIPTGNAADDDDEL